MAKLFNSTMLPGNFEKPIPVEEPIRQPVALNVKKANTYNFQFEISGTGARSEEPKEMDARNFPKIRGIF